MNKQLLKESIKRKEKTLFFFYAEWCEYCDKIRPTIKQIAESKPGYKLVELDDDDENTDDISELFNVNYLPALVILSESGYKTYEGSTKIKKLLS